LMACLPWDGRDSNLRRLGVLNNLLLIVITQFRLIN